MSQSFLHLEMVEEREGILSAEVVSAVELDDEQQKRVWPSVWLPTLASRYVSMHAWILRYVADWSRALVIQFSTAVLTRI